MIFLERKKPKYIDVHFLYLEIELDVVSIYIYVV